MLVILPLPSTVITGIEPELPYVPDVAPVNPLSPEASPAYEPALRTPVIVSSANVGVPLELKSCATENSNSLPVLVRVIPVPAARTTSSKLLLLSVSLIAFLLGDCVFSTVKSNKVSVESIVILLLVLSRERVLLPVAMNCTTLLDGIDTAVEASDKVHQA